MTPPDGIEPWAWDDARRVLSHRFTVPIGDRVDDVIAIARALMAERHAERERCARIAEGHDLQDHPKLSPGSEKNAWWSGQGYASTEIATAIRNGDAAS